MLKTKVLVSAVAFTAALAVPGWAVSVGETPHDSPASTAQGSDAGGMTGMGQGAAAQDWRSMDAQMAKRDKSFPAATKGEGAQLLQPKVLADGTKQFDLTAEVTKWETEPGKTVEAWTYNGVVPGPTIHVNVGDKLKLVLHNKLPESTVIHWHGLTPPNNMDGVADVTQDPVHPGATFTYSFTPKSPMVGWYHSHHDGTKQVSSGLYGTILVGEMPTPAGVKVSQELPFVLQDAGTIGMTINGKSFPATKPIRAHLGDWIEVHYVNAGTQAHPMHLHGVPQLVIAKDGYPLPQPYRADTVNVAPGERYTVLVHTTEPGKWAWHCHIFPHSEGAQGMFGLFTELLVS